MVALQCGQIVRVPIDDAVGELKTRRPRPLRRREHLLRLSGSATVGYLRRMGTALDDLIALLDLEPLEVNLFRGSEPGGGPPAGVRRPGRGPGARRRGPHRRRRPVGALAARLLPAPGRPDGADRLRGRPHPRRQELHHPARRRDPARPRDLQPAGVVPDRRGRARAPGRRCPTCRPPESLPTFQRAARAVPRPVRARDRRSGSSASGRSTSGPTELPSLDRPRARGRRARTCGSRRTASLPDDPLLHVCVVAYASDLTILDTAMLPHGNSYCAGRTSSRSRASTTRCGSTGRSAPTSGCCTTSAARSRHGARGLARGAIFRQDGVLAVTVIQEGLMRPMRTDALRR